MTNPTTIFPIGNFRDWNGIPQGYFLCKGFELRPGVTAPEAGVSVMAGSNL